MVRGCDQGSKALSVSICMRCRALAPLGESVGFGTTGRQHNRVGASIAVLEYCVSYRNDVVADGSIRMQQCLQILGPSFLAPSMA